MTPPPTVLHWPGGGGSWDPSQLSSLVAWYDADAITGLNDGDPISTWSDAHGVFDVSATSGERPIFKTSIQNSRPVVRFDGSDDRLKRSGSPITGTTARTFGIVAKADVVTYTSIIGIGKEAWSGSGNGQVFNITPEVAARVNGSKTFTTGFGTSAFRLLVMSCPSSAITTDISAWLDGAALTQSTTSGTSINTLSSGEEFLIGELGSFSSTANFDGDIAEIVVCDAEATTNDRQRLEGYLAHKWGLAANLPSSHPYKSNAP